MTFAHDFDLAAYIQEARINTATRLRAARFLLLRRLRMSGVSEVACTYGDSGNWEEVTLDRGRVVPKDDFRSALGDFAWDVAYFFHPGFENNEGGYGEVIWDIARDTISLDHAERFVDTNHSYHEGI